MPRDPSGTYTLPAGNPVVSGSIIGSVWANTTMPDIQQALTDSLSRSGSGGMLVPFTFEAGTVSAPGMGWTSNPSTGLYLAAQNDMRVSVNGADMLRWSATGVQVWDAVDVLWYELVNTKTGADAFLGVTDQAADSVLFDGQPASFYSPATHEHDTTYLGINAKADDADLLDGQTGSWYQKNLESVSSIELRTDLAGDATVYIDMHASAGTDYDARFVRWTGVDGDLVIDNKGTGDLVLTVGTGGEIRFNGPVVMDSLQVTQAMLLTAGTNLDTVTSGGIYEGTNLGNAPVGDTDWFWVEVITSTRGAAYVMQRATRHFGTSAYSYVRVRENNTWTGWSNIAP